MFRAEQFDPSAWISLFSKTGAKYVVPVAEHHDGFQMYRSDLSHWNSWCYTENNEFKSAKSILCDLVDIVSKNGNMLLNVGPKADGTISPEDTDVLLQIGAWMNANEEAI